MSEFETKTLPEKPDVTAPDGSDVRVLHVLKGGSMSHFELAAGRVSVAVAHRTVEEVWFFISGCGEMWRRQGEHESVVAVEPGVSLTIPLGAAFQFRSLGPEPLAAVAVTMPPWPGAEEAFEVPGIWEPSRI